MAAFDRILSGVAGMDQALDSIRLGDNVVLQVSKLEDYVFFAKAFAKQAISKKRNLIYIRFAQHEPILQPQEGLKIYEFDPEEGLETFENAVRTVYASTMDISALQYRKQRGLDKVDEQMAILVQRVSGSYYGDFYMPCAAGVGYSYSTYQWQRDLKPDAGMLRLVMGLGTKAVDRTENDYPRLVNLDRPAVWAAKY